MLSQDKACTEIASRDKFSKGIKSDTFWPQCLTGLTYTLVPMTFLVPYTSAFRFKLIFFIYEISSGKHVTYELEEKYERVFQNFHHWLSFYAEFTDGKLFHYFSEKKKLLNFPQNSLST